MFKFCIFHTDGRIFTTRHGYLLNSNVNVNSTRDLENYESRWSHTLCLFSWDLSDFLDAEQGKRPATIVEEEPSGINRRHRKTRTKWESTIRITIPPRVKRQQKAKRHFQNKKTTGPQKPHNGSQVQFQHRMKREQKKYGNTSKLDPTSQVAHRKPTRKTTPTTAITTKTATAWNGKQTLLIT